MTTVARDRTLWVLPLSPFLWSVHFMLCYLTAAIWCAKSGDATASLSVVRAAIVIYTIPALVGIGVVTFIGYRWWYGHGVPTPPHDRDTPEDRHRFMGFATILLSGLSAVAVLYSAAVVLFFETCQ